MDGTGGLCRSPLSGGSAAAAAARVPVRSGGGMYSAARRAGQRFVSAGGAAEADGAGRSTGGNADRFHEGAGHELYRRADRSDLLRSGGKQSGAEGAAAGQAERFYADRAPAFGASDPDIILSHYKTAGIILQDLSLKCQA